MAEKIKNKNRIEDDNENENKEVGKNLQTDKISRKNITETSDTSSHKIGLNIIQHKRITENFLLNNSTASDKRKIKNIFDKEDSNNKFLTFDHSHMQMSFLGKSFKNISNKILSKKLDEFLEREAVKNKSSFPHIEFNVEAIIDKSCVMKDENSNISNQLSISSSKNLSDSNLDNEQKNNISNSDIGKNPNSFTFFVISNIFIYDFEFLFTNSVNDSLILRRKINVLAIEYFSITPDLKKLIIHINNILDNGGNIFISNENSIHIIFCICNILFYCYSTRKTLVVIPKSKFFYEKIKKLSSFDKMKDLFNKYAEDIYLKIGDIIPYDKDEELIKLVPLSKIETKFTDSKIDKLLILTNKKILEISSENVEISKIHILPLSKMKKINEYYKCHKFQVVLDDGSSFQYSTIHTKMLIRLIKAGHSKECLLELEINRMD